MSLLRHPQTLGALALTGWTAHAACHLAKGTGLSLIWCCNLGALFLGLGLLSARPRLAGAGLLWVAVGTPLWLVGLTIGKLWMPTSLFTHFGALAADLLAGAAALPQGAWRSSLAGLFLVHVSSHALLPAGRDVNLTGQALGSGLPGHLVFTALVTAALLLLLPLFERWLRAASQPFASSTASRAASAGSSTACTPSS